MGTILQRLNEAGVSLCEKEDTLIWTGGDSSGRMSVKNIYATLISIYEWPQTKGWKYKLWKWEIQLKKKLFIWLAAENKILTWQVLQGKGWQGPGRCPLCKSEIEDVDHLICPLSIYPDCLGKLSYPTQQKISMEWKDSVSLL
jgi:hypothetical protein